MNKTAVLVNTCSRYHYIIPAFLTMLKRYWPEMVFPLYISSTGDLDKFRSIRDFIPLVMESDPGVLQSKLWGIERVAEEFVILLQEDFLIERFVDDTRIRNICDVMESDERVGCVRLMPSPPGTGQVYGNTELTRILKNKSYSFSFQAAMWRRTFLTNVMKDFINLRPWSENARLDQLIELNSQHFMPNYSHEILCVKRDGEEPNAVYRSPIPYRPTAIERGELAHWAKDLMEREGIL